MIKLCFWGIALVATLGLLGGSLAYPDTLTPTSDDEATQLVGGDQGLCLYWRPWYCQQYRLCSATCLTGWANQSPGDQGPAYANGTERCGPDTSCTVCYCGLSPCIVATGQ
jgi:hypothetical protein